MLVLAYELSHHSPDLALMRSFILDVTFELYITFCLDLFISWKLRIVAGLFFMNLCVAAFYRYSLKIKPYIFY